MDTVIVILCVAIAAFLLALAVRAIVWRRARGIPADAPTTIYVLYGVAAVVMAVAMMLVATSSPQPWPWTLPVLLVSGTGLNLIVRRRAARYASPIGARRSWR